MNDSAAPVATTRGLLPALVLLALLVAGVALRYRPPPPRPITAPPTEFSAARAMAELRDVLGDQRPHPLGSAANAAVRDRIVERLQAIGYAPAIQRGFACDERGDCGAVENIVARRPGREPGAAVVLSAHYDSVAAGPGAADDGAGVASLLEIARLLRQRPAPRHAIELLLTDGEEVGLLGARVFVDAHPDAREVRAAVNLEARGTEGPSFLFETGSANDWAMRLYGRLAGTALARPITNSIFYTAYKLLPNDTDYTVFKTRDWQGYNFAFTGAVQHYHTPLDDLAHLSAASLQHHGDNALATLLALAEADWPAADAKAESVYFDGFATRLLRWPAAAALPLAAVMALLALAVVARLLRRQRLRLRAVAWGLAAVPVAALLAALAGAGLVALLRELQALPPAAAYYGWTAEPVPLQVANAALALLAVALVALWAAPRAGFWGVWAATVLLLQAANLAAAWLLPGLSFVPLLPAVAALPATAPALWAREDRGGTRSLAALLPLAVGGAALLPTVWFLYATLGPDLLPACALLLAWMAAPLLALLAGASRDARQALVAAAAVLALAATGAAAWQPAYTAASPQRLNFEYRVDADRHAAEWLALPDSGRLPPALGAAQPFAPRAEPLWPWTQGGVFSAPASALDLAAPELAVLDHEPAAGGTHYRVRLTSPRAARTAGLCFPPEAALSNATVGGYRLAEPSDRLRAAIASRRKGWRCLAVHSMTADGTTLEFTLAATAPVDLLLYDRSEGLPAAGHALLAARPADAAPSQDGDVTRVVRRIRLGDVGG